MKFSSVILLLLIAAGVWMIRWGGGKEAAFQPETSATLDSIAKEEVESELAAASVPPLSDVVAAVVPHHYVAKALIARAVRSLADAHPQTIVVIGPDHPNNGMASFTTTNSDWVWAGQILQTRTDIVSALLEDPAVLANDSTIRQEHSVFVPAPFLAMHFKNSQFVFLTVRSDTDPALSRLVAARLHALLGPDDIVIASVDFSHGQPFAAAEKEDDRSRAALQSGMPERVSEIYADSKPSIAVAMEFARLRSASHRVIVDHSNSAVLLGDMGAPSTTSYFTMMFSRSSASPTAE